MGKKSSPKAPDYTKVAEQQATVENEQNQQNTWANRVNQYNPYGSSTFNAKKAIDPVTGKPVTQWSQTQTLDPQLQAALKAQFGLTADRSQLAESLFGGMERQLGKPIDYSQFQDYGNAPKAGKLQATTSGKQSLQTTTNPNAYADLIRSAGKGVQGSLNFSGLNDVGDAAATRKRAEDTIYKQAASRLDPQWKQRQSDFETQLANRGVTTGSEAYTKALTDFNSGRNDAYNQAQMSAITGGGAEAERDFGMDMGLRQQQMNEILSGGQFRNQAQAQRYGQGLDAAGLGLNAQQQAFGQREAAGQFGLNAQDQAFGQRQQAGAQNFAQGMDVADYDNKLRQQQITEAMQKRGYGIDEINALLSGAEVNMPQFGGYNQAGMGSAADYTGAANSGYQAQMNAANAKQAGQANTMSTVASVAGTAMMIY
jgi:hypothetical protein